MIPKNDLIINTLVPTITVVAAVLFAMLIFFFVIRIYIVPLLIRMVTLFKPTASTNVGSSRIILQHVKNNIYALYVSTYGLDRTKKDGDFEFTMKDHDLAMVCFRELLVTFPMSLDDKCTSYIELDSRPKEAVNEVIKRATKKLNKQRGC